LITRGGNKNIRRIVEIWMRVYLAQPPQCRSRHHSSPHPTACHLSPVPSHSRNGH